MEDKLNVPVRDLDISLKDIIFNRKWSTDVIEIELDVEGEKFTIEEDIEITQWDKGKRIGTIYDHKMLHIFVETLVEVFNNKNNISSSEKLDLIHAAFSSLSHKEQALFIIENQDRLIGEICDKI